MDHDCTKSIKEFDRSYTMLEVLRSVVVGEASIHKNREGSNCMITSFAGTDVVRSKLYDGNL